MRFDGNSILIADPDTSYGLQLSDALTFHGARCSVAEHLSAAKIILKRQDFDMVISNYYLADGIIHQLIDWCTAHLPTVPVFTCIGYPFPTDSEISRKHSIADTFSKNDSRRILNSVSNLLFNSNDLKESLHELAIPTEILIELHISGKTHMVRPIEITEESVFLQLDSVAEKGSFGILKFSLINEGQTQNFLIPGHMDSQFPGGQLFKVNPKYLNNWNRFLTSLNLKQMKITHFLNKVSGI